MANLNCVLLIGRLTRDPELRFTSGGASVCNFGLAVNRMWTDSEGNKKEEVCFVDIVAWSKTAENVDNYLSKGSQVFIEGRLQYRTWETKEGYKRSKLEVVADRVQFMDAKGSDNDTGEDDDRPC